MQLETLLFRVVALLVMLFVAWLIMGILIGPRGGEGIALAGALAT